MITNKTSKSFYNLLILSLHLTITSLVVLTGSCDAKTTITKGPFLLRVYSDSAAVMWETNEPGPNQLRYGKDKQLDNHIITEPIQIEYNTQVAGIKKIVFIHKIWLKNLAPGQSYSYQITEGQLHSFRTIPADVNEVTFIVYGDSRSDPQIHRKLVELMIKKNVDFVINSGDLVLTGGKYEQWGPQFFEPLKGLAESVPIYLAKGNHDLGNGYFEKLLTPAGEENNYGFNYGPLYYFLADNVSKDIKKEELINLIGTKTQNSNARWKFVSYHKPSLNFGGHSSRWGHPTALPTLTQAGVDFIITGHSHIYERFLPLQLDKNLLTCITSGGGGATMYHTDSTPYHYITKKEHHFCLFNIKDDKLTIDVININGQVIDHLELNKISGHLNKQYQQTAVPLEAVQLHQSLRKAKPKLSLAKMQNHQPANVKYKLSIPALVNPAKITFTLTPSDDGSYKLPAPKTIEIPKEGTAVTVKFEVTPLVDVTADKFKHQRNKLIVPRLWLNCDYKIGAVHGNVKIPVIAKIKK